jgi:hypothetical protein
MKKASVMLKADTVGVEAAELPSNSTAVCPKQPSKLMLNKEISIIMLVMAAQTLSGVTKMQENVLSTELVAEWYNFHDRPWLHDKMFKSASFYSAASSMEQLPYVTVSDGISSSGGNSDSSESCDDDRDEEDVAAAQLASRLTTPCHANRRFAHNEDVWEDIFSFLPWEAALEVRSVSRFHFSKSLARVTIARMPQSKTPAVFIPCLEDLDADEMAVEAELAPLVAGSSGGATGGSGGQRLFLGQLRRTGTVPMVRWLVNTVFNAPPGALVSVENRRNTHTQRGKGCAWATINDAATVERMLGAHHRLFFDTVDGVEGVWLVPEGHEGALQTEVSLRNEGSAHVKHMPRGTIVVEVPASTTVPSAPAALPGYVNEARSTLYGGKVPHHGAAAPAYGRDASRWSAGVPCLPYPLCETMPPPPPMPMPMSWVPAMDAMADRCVGFTPYRVPGADFVQPGMYRHNPYTTMA